MDNIVPDGFSSCYNRKSKKCQRDAIQAQLVKEQKLIDKGENVCSREMGKDQERVRKCLEKLENDKKKFCRDFEPSRGNSPFPFHDDRAHSRGSFRPLSGYDVKSQSRSRRQLQEAGATSMDLKRASSRRSFEQGSVSPEPPKGRQRSHSLSLPSPVKKVTHGLRNMPSVENGKALPDGAIPSIILTEEDCKEPSILYLSPNAKSTDDIASITQGSESDRSNKKNRVCMNQDHPANHGFREHKPSTKGNPKQESNVTKEKPKSGSHALKENIKHDHHVTKDKPKHDSHVANDNTKHSTHAHYHHVKEKPTSHGAHDHHGNVHGAQAKHDNHEHDRHHGARAKHGHHDNIGSHDQHKPHHHHHGSRPILKDHHDSQSGLSSLRDSRHGQHDSAHHSHSPRESSRQSHILENRRSSLAGQTRRIAIENNMEEAQNLYELALRSVADAHHKPSLPNVQGRRGSLPGERRGSLPGALPGERRVSLSSDKPSLLTLPDHIPNMSMLDKSAMDDLQELLHEVRIYRDRKTSEDQGHCHSQSRNQRKRLEHIEAILEKLSRHSATKFDPQEMLACGYLRLSKHNIETLESMIKDSGQDPGIHAHSDVREYDLWADIKRENELEEAAAHAPSVSPTKKIKG